MFIDDCLLTGSTHYRRARELAGVPLIRAPIAAQRPHLQILSWWGLDFNI